MLVLRTCLGDEQMSGERPSTRHYSSTVPLEQRCDAAGGLNR
jgi:hypothetical protein